MNLLVVENLYTEGDGGVTSGYQWWCCEAKGPNSNWWNGCSRKCRRSCFVFMLILNRSWEIVQLVGEGWVRIVELFWSCGVNNNWWYVINAKSTIELTGSVTVEKLNKNLFKKRNNNFSAEDGMFTSSALPHHCRGCEIIIQLKAGKLSSARTEGFAFFSFHSSFKEEFLSQPKTFFSLAPTLSL